MGSCQPFQKRAALGLLAMHKRPSKSSFKSAHAVRKKASFAVFQNYTACRGYRFPAFENCIQTIQDVGYSIPPHERVVIRPTLPANLQWTSMRPSISFGTVQDLLSSVDRAPPSSGGNHGPLNVDVHDHVGSSSVCATGRVEHVCLGRWRGPSRSTLLGLLIFLRRNKQEMILII